jgi:tetratricopeptide (TPR) repeat protein
LRAQTAYWTGYANLTAGRLAPARSDFQCVLELVGDSDDTGRAYALHGLGDAARIAGELGEAEEYLTTAAQLAAQAADAVLEGRVHRSLAALHRARGQLSRQASDLIRAAACFRGCDAPFLEARALSELGEVSVERGDIPAARAALTAAQVLYVQLRLPEAERVGAELERLSS